MSEANPPTLKQLQEKAAGLQRDRAGDQEKLKQYEKRLRQLQHLLEEKMKEEEEKVRKEEEIEFYEESQISLKEAAEMATIDKEIAEEKLECLQVEMLRLQNLLAETALELKGLREEIEAKGLSEVAHSAILLKKENEIDLMKDALLKARKLVTSQQEEKECLTMEIGRLKSLIGELEASKNALSELCQNKQAEIEELKEQVDAAQGAEEIIEYLTSSNLKLEKANAVFQEKMENLERLQDINDEIQEASKESEMELNEELEKARVKLAEMSEKRKVMEKDIDSLKDVISKYKELVDSLKRINGDLRFQLAEATNQAPSASSSPESFKTKYLEKKDLANSIEHELRKYEMSLLHSHVAYLCSFMPEGFLAFGGDHDSILMMILIPRLIVKTEVISKHARGKFVYIDSVDLETIISTYRVEESGFLCRLLNSLYSLQTLLHQYLAILNGCSVDLFQKLSGFYGEMLPQENNLDKIIELLQKDSLDENTDISNLNRSISFFKGLYQSHLLNEKGNHTLFLIDYFKASETTCNGIKVFIESLIVLAEKYGFQETGGKLRDIALTNIRCRDIIRKIRRQVPQDKDSHELQLPDSELRQIEKNKNELFEAFCVFMQCYTEIRQQLITYEEETSIQRYFETSFQKKEYTTRLKEAHHSIEAFHGFLLFLHAEITEGSRDVVKEERPLCPPVILRSQTVKERIKDLENLLVDLEAKEMTICELRNALLQKCEELNEMNIRRELSEKRHGSAVKVLAEKCRVLQKEMEESRAQKIAAENAFRDKLAFLKRELRWLELERMSLKSKIQNAARKSYTLAQEMSPKICQETSLMIQELEMLRRAIRHLQLENARLSGQQLKSKLSNLPDLVNIREPSGNGSRIQAQLEEVLLQSNLLLSRPAMVDLSHKQGFLIQVSLQRAMLKRHNETMNDLNSQMLNLAKIKQCGAVDCDFASFPRNLVQSQPELIARLSRKSMKSIATLDGAKSLDLDYSHLARIHRCILEL